MLLLTGATKIGCADLVEYLKQGEVIVPQQTFVTVASARPVTPVARSAVGIESLKVALGVAREHRQKNSPRVLAPAQLVKRFHREPGITPGRAAVFITLKSIRAGEPGSAGWGIGCAAGADPLLVGCRNCVGSRRAGHGNRTPAIVCLS